MTADADGPPSDGLQGDRRALIRRAALAAGAVLAASSTGLLPAVRDAAAFGDADLSVLRDAIRMERISVLAYDRLIAGGRLTGSARAVARRLRGQDQQHADALTKALTELGQPPPPAPVTKDIDSVVKGIADVDSRASALSFAIELETALVGSYHDAQTKLYDAKLLQLAATIMGDEGQHLVLLRQAAGMPRVPNALEDGTSP